MAFKSIHKPKPIAQTTTKRPFTGHASADGARRLSGFGSPAAAASLPSGWLEHSSSRSLDEGEDRAIRPALGATTSTIRVHEDASAKRMTSKLGADAFTVGDDIYFSSQARRSAGAGLRLLAHEASHVAQQSTRSKPWVQRSPGCTSPEEFTPTTRQTALSELTDTPCHTFMNSRLGDYGDGHPHSGYKFKYGSKTFYLKASKGANWFGIHYGGSAKKNVAKLESISADTDTYQFSPANSAIIDAIKPIFKSEGGLSSINTWDNEFLTLAGRGEKSGRVTKVINAAEKLSTAFGVALPSITEVRGLVTHLSQASPLGTAGPRFDMPQILKLIQLLEENKMFTAMVLATVSDSILTYYGVPISGASQLPLYNDGHSVTPAMEAETEEEVLKHGLEPVTMTVAIHNRLGSPSDMPNPHRAALDANRIYPQDQAITAKGEYDFAQLSRQLAYLMKTRDSNGVARRGTNNVEYNHFQRWVQKVNDFGEYFKAKLPDSSEGFFVPSAARDVIPAWGDSSRKPTKTKKAPTNGNFSLSVKPKSEGGEVGFVDMGPPLIDHNFERVAATTAQHGQIYILPGPEPTSLDQSIVVDGAGAATVVDSAPVSLSPGTRVIIIDNSFVSTAGGGADPRNGGLEVFVEGGSFGGMEGWIGKDKLLEASPEG